MNKTVFFKDNLKIDFVFFILFMMLLSSTVNAQQNEDWDWSMTYSNPIDGAASVAGTATSLAEAESAMKGSCSICNNVAIDYQIRYSGGTVISVYQPSPQDFPSDYGSWLDNLALRLQQAIDTFPSSPECSPSTSMQSGGWYDPNAALAPNIFIPSLRERTDIDIIANYYNATQMACEPYTWEKYYFAIRTRDAVCPAAYVAVTAGSGPFTKICRAVMTGGITSPPQDEKNEGCTGDNGEGNPCNVATGNKHQIETDFFQQGLSFSRAYNSRNLSNLGFGRGWRNNHQKELIIYSGGTDLLQVSETGRGELWKKVSDAWQGDADSDVLITENASGFQLANVNGAIENYNLTGRMLSKTDTNGAQTIYTYNVNDQLEQVTSNYGHGFSFSYVNDNLDSVIDILGEVYQYEYDTNNNLVSVIYPDATLNDNSDNPRKTYHYENVDYPNHLTGITDENGNRYATYAYDTDGKAISTEHSQTTNAVGQEKFELDYQGAN